MRPHNSWAILKRVSEQAAFSPMDKEGISMLEEKKRTKIVEDKYIAYTKKAFNKSKYAVRGGGVQMIWLIK